MSEKQFSWRQISYRIAFAVFVFSLAIIAFESGVGVSDQPDLPEAMLLTKIYYALGLFVLGGLDLGVPQSGPWWGQAMLWGAYFGCPAIATAAVAEGVGRILRARRNGVEDLDDHTVVIGDGQLAQLYVEAFLEESSASHDLLLVRRGPSQQTSSASGRDKTVHEMTGDPTNRQFAQQLGLEDARRVLLLSDDDIWNLETALFFEDDLEVSSSRMVVHLSDVSLKRDVQEKGLLSDDVTIFNSHEIAAEHLLDEQIESFFQKTDYSDEVILAGFGRFGQSMLEQLDKKMPGEFHSVILLDRHASSNHRLFKKQVDLQEDYAVETIDGDMQDPRHWETAIDHLSESTREPVVVLGADDDAVNLQVALLLQQTLPEASLFVRTMGTKHLAGAMAKQPKFQIENVHDRMSSHMKENDEFGLA